MGKAKVGFAAMDPAKQREIASMGGTMAHMLGVSYEWTSEEAASAGRLGGLALSADSAHMAEIGRRGGETVSRNVEHMREIGGKGGSSVSDGPRGRAHMREIGRKGAAARAAKRAAR